MGLSSSQARLLSLTGRMHDIEYKAQKLEAQKLQMANESTHVYREYEDAINATKIQYKTIGSDGTSSFSDASYASLCLYQEGMSNVQYALADTKTGFIYVPKVVEDTYKNTVSGEDFALKMSGLTVIPAGAVTPTDDLNNVPVEPDGNLTLKRGEKSAVTVGTTAMTLTLTNPLGGSNYKYTISSAGGNSAASFEFLNNGRLVIRGNGLTIDAAASDSQNDDIILMGNNNNLNTYGGDDIVRIGSVHGFGAYRQDSSNNTVNTGSGNDYITNYGYNNVIDGGSGTDSYMREKGDPTNSNIEQMFNVNDLTLDGKDGWVSQGGLGDCRFLSLLNALALKNKDLTQYASITQAGDNYTVVFKNYAEKNNTITVTKTEINNSGYAKGDGDVRVLEYALNKLMTQNGDGNLKSCTWNEISKYMLGNDKVGIYNNSEAKLNEMWNAYNTGAITNLLVSTTDLENPTDGIVAGHAYAIKNVTAEYVELINPWDDRDVLKLDKMEFHDYFPFISTFGSPAYSNGYFTNGAGVSVLETTTTTAAKNVYAGDAADDAAKYNYYIRLYNAIKAAGGCINVPDTMLTSTDWLTNMINGGSVYIKAVDSDNNWYDTSVATNTSLQEVNNEKNLKKAEAKYESDMRKIDAKDKKYDTDLAAMESERNAIKTEIDTLKSVAKDNVDRAFKLFT